MGRKLNQVSPEILIIGADYVVEDGQWVFTDAYHLRRGYCCRNGCRYCPYDGRTPLERNASQASAGNDANESCSSCGEEFECRPGNCWCDKVQVPREALAALRTRFERCLCPKCLRDVVAKFK